MTILLTIAVGLAGIMPFVSAQPEATICDLEINHAATFWGIPMDSNWDTPAWHIRAAIAHLFDKQQFMTSINIVGTLIDNPLPNTGGLAPWYLGWTPAMLSAVDPMHPGAVSLYNNVPMLPDFSQALDHLIAAGGIGNDGSPWHDNNPADGIIDNPPTQASKILYYYNVGNVIRQTVGLYIEQQIEYIFGADVMDILGVPWAIWLPIHSTWPPADDWNLAFMGYRYPCIPSYLDDWLELYCTPNWVFYSNSAYDTCVSAIPPPTNALPAQFEFGRTIGAIPIWFTT